MQTDSVGQDLTQGRHSGMACLSLSLGVWFSAKDDSDGWGLAGVAWRKRVQDAVSMGILAPGEAAAGQGPLPQFWLEQRINQLAKIKCQNLTPPGPTQSRAGPGHSPGEPTLVHKSGDRRPALFP